MRQKMMFVVAMMLAACASVPEVEDVASTEGELTVSAGIWRQEIDVHTGLGPVHTTAVYTTGARLRADRRVVLLVPGTLANGAGYYDVASGTGYDTAEILARAGYVAVMVDLPGTGESFRPSDGATAGTELAAWALRRVMLRYAISTLAPADGFDVYAETGIGTSVLLTLARESYVRTIVGSAVFYRRFGPFTGPTLFDPGFRAVVSGVPGGYLPQDPSFIAGFLPFTEPVLRDEVVAACLGPMPTTAPTGPFVELFAIPFTPEGPEFVLSHPIVDAAPARAPALFVQGSPDPIGSELGTAELEATYGTIGGGDAEVVTLVGASHLMRFDAVTSDGPTSPFWSAVLAFLAAN